MACEPDAETLRVDLCREMLREAEGVVAAQFDELSKQADKADKMNQLGILCLVFGLALGTAWQGQVQGRGAVPAAAFLPAAIVLTAGIASNVVALYFLVHSFNDLRGTRTSNLVPDTAWLVQRVAEPGMTLEIHLRSMLAGMPACQASNHALLASTTKTRRRGLQVLACATVPLYLAGLVFIALRSFA